MVDKEKQTPAVDEPILDFEEAKEMTVGQAVRKHEDLRVGISEEDGILDRYIKQHREAIEANKFETKTDIQPLSDEDIQAVQAAITPENDENDIEVTQEFVVEEGRVEVLQEEEEEPTPVAPLVSPVQEDDWDEADEEEPLESSKKTLFIWAGLLAAFVAILAATFIWMNGDKKAPATSTTSSESSSSASKSSSTKAASLANFDTLYKTFFTDEKETHLKNSSFEQLPDLKAILDKMDSKSEDYKTAKGKYDKLEKAIKAIQTLNSQFDKPVLVDGKLDQTAKVKSGVTLAAVATGLSGVDNLITSAVNHGLSQQTTTTTTTEATTAAPSQAAPAEGSQAVSEPSTPNLQRNVSRVPYDQAAIDDANNEAWTFAPGVLENILNISRQRGYITGDDYILEKVNIINGNGYYNLFRPDGTYLFSINAKTGYFVGNGSGNADDLDY